MKDELHEISWPETSADGLLCLEACRGFRLCPCFSRASANIAVIIFMVRESWKWLWTGSLRNRGSILGMWRNFTLFHCTQTDSGVHPLGTEGLFSRAKTAGVTSIQHRDCSLELVFLSSIHLRGFVLIQEEVQLYVRLVRSTRNTSPCLV